MTIIQENCDHGDEWKQHDAMGLYCWGCAGYISNTPLRRAIGFLNDAPTRLDWLLVGLFLLLLRHLS